MNFAVLQFPASNCDQDAVHGVRLLGHSATVDSVYRLLKRIRRLGTMLMLQRDVNDAATEAVALLEHMASVIAQAERGETE